MNNDFLDHRVQFKSYIFYGMVRDVVEVVNKVAKHDFRPCDGRVSCTEQ